MNEFTKTTKEIDKLIGYEIFIQSDIGKKIKDIQDMKIEDESIIKLIFNNIEKLYPNKEHSFVVNLYIEDINNINISKLLEKKIRNKQKNICSNFSHMIKEEFTNDSCSSRLKEVETDLNKIINNEIKK
jgi:hypothetical protein